MTRSMGLGTGVLAGAVALAASYDGRRLQLQLEWSRHGWQRRQRHRRRGR